MHIRHALSSFLIASYCVGDVLGRHALQRRQNSNDLMSTVDSTASSRGDINLENSLINGDGTSSTPEPSTGTLARSISELDSESSTAYESTGSGLKTSRASPVVDQENSTASASNAEPTSSVKPGTLPIKPVITPAVGIGGVVLIAAGIALCLVGIKHEWLYVFLSTALLGSLAVTVLILYVMDPPVSDAVQGAFLVAAVATGLIFGVISLLFKEVTDNLGCLLGGFCFAMWLLVLTPGGIISSTAGRGILIGLLCAGAFAMSFSHYTRSYSLIVCTSFAGATATIVGIDCFSRAGLKEFWIYLWNLNDKEFPPGTDTYPVTRGIKVEIACIIILFVFGVLSQFKIWRVIKQHRSKKEDERFQRHQAREQEEEAVGRDVEAANQRDLVAWEATYGDKNGTQVDIDSGLGSSRKSSQGGESLKDRSADGFELAECSGSHGSHIESKEKSRPSVTIRVASGDWDGVASSRDDLLRSESSSIYTARQSTVKSIYPVSETGVQSDVQEEKPDASFADAPPVPPLPFTVPAAGEDKSNESLVSGTPDDRDVIGQDVQGPVNDSLGGYLELLGQRDDDGASSVAATADDDDNAMFLSRAASPDDTKGESDRLVDSSQSIHNDSGSSATGVDEDELLEEEDEEALSRPVVAPDSDKPDTQSRRSSVASRRSSLRRSVQESSVAQLPPQLSKIAQVYRTNEWAKHIAGADIPADIAEDEEPPSPGILVDTAFTKTKETAKPVDVEDLKPTISSLPLQSTAARNDTQVITMPKRQSSSQAILSRTSSTQSAAQMHPLSSKPSAAASFKRQYSSASGYFPAIATDGTRDTPTPLASQPLIESPVEDALAASGPYRRLSSYEASSNTLMDQRHHQLKQRPITTSFNAPPSNPQLNITAPSDASTATHRRHTGDSISLHSIKQALIEDEDMTLAQRRDLVRQQRRLSNPQQPPRQSTHPPLPATLMRSSTTPLQPPPESTHPPVRATPMRSSTNPTAEALIYDSHQPKRPGQSPALDQSLRLKEWRQSLQPKSSSPNLNTRQSVLMEENARIALLSSQRQAEWAEAKKKEKKAARESQMEAAMRSGVLHGAHRDALRKMQAKARDSAGA